MAVNDSRYLGKLGLAIGRHFTPSELTILAGKLGLDPEIEASYKKDSMADKMVQQIVRDQRLTELRDLLVELKPLVSWPSPKVFTSNIGYLEDLPAAKPGQPGCGCQIRIRRRSPRRAPLAAVRHPLPGPLRTCSPR